LRNLELYIPRARLPKIDENDTFYHADLIGLDAVAPDGAQIGTVHALHNFGAGDIIEIMPVGSREPLMLPFNETTVPKIDLAAKQIVVVRPAEIEARDD
jgi:16S rRNA processing protein RimM